MTNEDLLIVARGMGFNARLYLNRECIYVTETGYKFNPTEGELMKWLLERGCFTLVHEDCIKYQTRFNYINTGEYLESRESDLKQNLLNIVLQVVNDKARYLEGESE